MVESEHKITGGVLSAGSNSPRGERVAVVPEVSTIEGEAHVCGEETLAARLKEGLSTINLVWLQVSASSLLSKTCSCREPE